MNATIRHRHRLLLPIGVAALLVSACGSRAPVAMPGVATVGTAQVDASADPIEMFTEVARVDATPTVDSTTTATVATTTTVVPVSADVDPVPVPGLVGISGWPAFDLHVQTIIAAGSEAVSATVMYEGEVVHEVAFGRRFPDGPPAAVGDRFRVASISKVVTAITLLRLVQAGQIDLDAPVGERLAQRVGIAPSQGVAEITPRHLLTHRSGIGQYENLMFRREVESCEEAGAVGLGRDLERAPGTTLRYSNLNSCLLGLLIEDVTGRPYADVVRDELLTPLGIDGMRIAGTFDVRDGEVEHRSDSGRNYMEVLGAAGSWLASSRDIATIVDALDLTTTGWKPLGSELLAEMTTITVDPPPSDPDPATTTPDITVAAAPPTPPMPPPTKGYGMGLMLFGPGLFGHTGTLESTHAMTVRQNDGYTWAITVSGDHPSSSRDLAGIVAAALLYAGI